MAIRNEIQKTNYYLKEIYDELERFNIDLPKEKNLKNLKDILLQLEKTGETVYKEHEEPLPMPVSQITLTPEKYTRGKGTVSFIKPEEADSVDILIKKDNVPLNINDYDQKVETKNNSVEIIFEPDEEGNYSDRYGIWGIAKNHVGNQTALNNSNRKLFRPLYAKGKVLEAYTSSFSGSASYWTSDSTTYGPHKLCIDRLNNLIFFSNYYTSSGLFVLDCDTNKITQILTSGGRYWDITEINNNIYFINSNSSNCYEYDHNTGTIKQLWSTAGYNQKVETNRYWIFTSGNSNGAIQAYNKETKEWKNLGLAYCNIYKTNDGVFAYNAYGTSSSYEISWKFNEDTCTFINVKHASGDTSPYTSGYSKMYEDKYGGIWMAFEKSYAIWKWDGTVWQSTLAYEYSFYSSSIFKMGNDNYYIKGGKLFKFNGDSIELISSDFNNATPGSVRVYEQDNGYYIMYYNSSKLEVYFYDREFVTILDKPSAASAVLTYTNQVGNSIYTNANGTIYKIENKIFTSLGANALMNFQQLGNNIYATNTSGYDVYKLIDNAFVQILTTSTSYKVTLLEKDNLIYIVQHSPIYTTAAEQYIQIHNPLTEENLITDKRVRYHMGKGNYYSVTDKKVYNILEETEELVSIPGCTNFSNGADGGTDANLWSDISGVLYVTESKTMTLLYLL